MTRTPLIVCFSGRIGSGKSSVIGALSNALKWQRAGFGDYLRRRITEQGGDASSRQALQDLGQSLVESDPDAFCLAVLQFGKYREGASLLVDGIRHVDIYRRIVRLTAPACVRLIHLEADDTQIAGRVAARAHGSADLPRAEGHPVEAELAQSLPSIADVIIDANQPLPTVFDDCIDAIVSFGLPHKAAVVARKSFPRS